MAEQSLKSLDVRSRTDRQRSCCMAKIVRCEAIQANRPGCWLPDVAAKVCVVEHSPGRVGKDEVVRSLPLDVLLELIDYESRDRHRSALVVLRRVQLKRSFG